LTTAEIAEVAKLSDEAKALLSDDLSPSKYVDLLESKKLFKDAIFFLVYGLPILIGVRWAGRCCRELLTPEQLEKSKDSLEAAEAWSKSPDDETRRAAQTAAQKDGIKTAPDLLAMGVFFSGGSVVPPKAPETPPPPYVAQKMTANAIQIAVMTNTPEKAAERFQKALQISREIVKSPK
jgi:hypothetical protein